MVGAALEVYFVICIYDPDSPLSALIGIGPSAAVLPNMMRAELNLY